MEQKKTEIFIRTRERIFVRRSMNKLQAFCAECQTETVFVLPEQAAMQTGTSIREIFRRLENGAIHFTEMTDGLTLVCQQSLLNINFAKILDTKE